MKFSCPNCGQRLAVKTLHGGRSIPCPKCGGPLTIPRSGPADPSTAAKPDAGAPGAETSPEPAPRAPVPPVDPALDPVRTLASEHAKRYARGDLVARGGMGMIVDATDVNIRRSVAMKVLQEGDRANREDILRFIEEAQVTGQLEHPGVVPVHELGVDGSGNVFYTMKFVRGLTLKQILRRLAEREAQTVRDYPLSQLLTVFQKVSDAIAFAHSRRVIHRDLKPENIMVGQYGEVLVLDWGLAKILPAVKTRELRRQPGTPADRKAPRAAAPAGVHSIRREDPDGGFRTMAGAVMGTPGYMAPEQAEGNTEDLDERADIYALGAILYAILTLRPPIEAKTVDEAIAKTISGAIADPLKPAPTVRPKTAGPKRSARKGQTAVAGGPSLLPHCPRGTIPESLAAVAMKALARNPADRYASVPLLQKDITAYQTGFATSAEAASLWRHVGLFVRRHHAAAAAAAVVAAMLVVSSIVNLEARLRAVRALEARNVLAKQAAPEFLAKSRRYLQDGNLAQALATVDIAIGLDDGAPEPFLQKGCILQDLLRFSESVAAFRRAEALGMKSDALTANLQLSEKLGRILEERRPRGGPAQAYPVEVMAPLASSLEAQGRLAEAGLAYNRVAQNSGELLRRWQTHLRAAGPPVFRNPDEVKRRLWIDEAGRMRLNLNGLADTESLAFIAGMPLYALDLTGVPRNLDLSPVGKSSAKVLILRDNPNLLSLAGLRGLKLKRIDLGRCTGLQSLDGLQGSEIEELDLRGLHRLRDVSALADAPLKTLHLGDCRAVTSLAALKKCRFEKVNLSRCSALTSLDGLQNSALTELDARECASLADLGALRGQPLGSLDLGMGYEKNLRLQTLDGLQGTKLGRIDLNGCRGLKSLAALAGLTVTNLDVRNCSALESLDGLESARLTSLDLAGCASVKSVSALKESALTRINLRECRSLVSLDGLQKSRLTHLDMEGCVAIADIRALRGQPLERLNLDMGYGHALSLKSLDGLQGTGLRWLNVQNCRSLEDLTALRSLPLTNLLARGCGNITSLSGLDDTPLENLDQSGCARFGDLRPHSSTRLKTLVLAGCQAVANLDPLRGLPLTTVILDECKSLKTFAGLEGSPLVRVHASGCPKLYDVSALKAKTLTGLSIGGSLVDDIEVLRGMPLARLNLSGTRIKDIQPLQGVPLEALYHENTQVRDLSPLCGAPLTELSVRGTAVEDLTPLQDMKLARLNTMGAKIADLRPLEGMELEALSITPRHVKSGLDVLRGMKSLAQIHPDGAPGPMAPAEFWRQFDEGKFR